MAQRRMISKYITHQSKFLSMPLETQALYFHLTLEADDDGYCEGLFVCRMINANEQSLGILAQNNFIVLLDNMLLHITEWEKGNKIQPTRYTKSEFKDRYPIAMSTSCQQDVNILSTQYSIGKDSIGKDREERENEPTLTLKRFNKRSDINTQVLKEMSERYAVSLEFVEDCWDTAQNWLDANATTKKDYKAFLSNWVKRERANRLLKSKNNYGGKVTIIEDSSVPTKLKAGEMYAPDGSIVKAKGGDTKWN